MISFSIRAFLIISLLFFASGDAFGKNGCSLQGSWIGFDEDSGLVSWMSQVTGKDATHGTIIIDMVGLAAAYDVDNNTELRGVWEKTGGNTFAYTAVGIASDMEGNPIFIGKASGRETLLDGCNEEWVTDGMVELFLPTQNPFDPEEEPFQVLPLTDHMGYRMHIDLY